MSLLLFVSTALFTIAALIVGFGNHDLVGALILGGIAAFVGSGAGFGRLVVHG